MNNDNDDCTKVLVIILNVFEIAIVGFVLLVLVGLFGGS